MKTNEYPWDGLVIPNAFGVYVAQLVSDEINPQGLHVFWAKSWTGHPALLVEYQESPWTKLSLPTFKNILVTDHHEEGCVALELLDQDMSDIFFKVCIDIIGAIQDVPDVAIRRACILRLERWSSFLKPSRSKLSPEAQKGLIAELQFLKHDALSACGEDVAIKGWTGPDAGPRDFAYGQVFIEVKSKRGSANTSIMISSEEQLNVNPAEQLFLYVLELNDAASNGQDSFSISDVVEETRDAIESPLQRVALDSKLANVGFFDEDDYSDQRWSAGSSYYYAVIDGFPKIDSHSCAPGVSGVTYQIDLDYCDDFMVERDKVIGVME